MTAPPRTGTGIESARRVSDCATALLRDQPFFGSLAHRLPLRIDPDRETLASDGHEICYSPRWIADTDADLIKTAIGRVVLACALKHHTRRQERDPKRSRERFLTDAEFTRLGQVLDEVSGKGSRVSTGAVATIRLLMLTGCRRNEILTLRWDHLDTCGQEMPRAA